MVGSDLSVMATDEVAAVGGIRPFDGGVTSPTGYLAAGVHCGIKRRRPDLALLVSEDTAAVAAVFTTNRVQAAPVRVSREAVGSGRARAIVVNSGNANACTGVRGLADAREMVTATARALGVPASQVLVASTGIIGRPLPMEAVRPGIRRAVAALSPDGEAASRAILTTDRFPKTAAARLDVEGHEVTIGGMAKGAGMIHPDMATTLGFLTTDAALPVDVLREALRETIDGSFNAITVDGDTSTNDAVFLLANGRSGAPAIEGGPALERFTEGLSWVAGRLARMVVEDGEGATRVAEIVVDGALDDAEARRAAFQVANSLLVKTALHGGDPNWGRIMAALGSAGVELEEGRTRIRIGDALVVQRGVGVPGNVERAARALAGGAVVIRIDLGVGDGRARVWTSDLSEEYVRINGSYSS